MNLEDSEAKKVFNFILEHKSIKLDRTSVFSREFLTLLWKIISSQSSQSFQLNRIQEKFLIQTFIKNPTAFNSNTPTCILENIECIKLASRINADSINYLISIPPEIKGELIQLASNEHFALSSNAPDFFRSDFSVALNSIQNNVFSADYLIWENFSEEEVSTLIHELLNSDYILHSESSAFLMHNKQIALKSLQFNIDNLKYVSIELHDDNDISKMLIMNDVLSVDGIKTSSLGKILDQEVMRKVFSTLGVYVSFSEQYKEKICQLFSDALNTTPKIETFTNIFDFIAEDKWNEHREENPNIYENIFARLCSYLRNSSDFSKLPKLPFLEKMKEVLEPKKFENLEQAMKEYIKIYHSNIEDKFEKLENSKNIIATLSASYVSKCKENFKKDCVSDLLDFLYEFYILDTDNPFVKRRVSYYNKKRLFKFRYLDSDSLKFSLISELEEKYSNQIDKKLISLYLSQFIENNFNDLESIEVPPKNYHSCVLYKKASKLINRLNSHYISFGDPSVTNEYKTIIGYNFNTDKYYYDGPELSSEDFDNYDAYEEHLRIFKQIKKDISLKINGIVIEDDLDLAQDDSNRLANELPFKDEFFKFDTDIFRSLTINDFISLISKNNSSDEDSLLDMDSYLNLSKLLIDNGLMWLILFCHIANIELISDVFDSTTLGNLIDSMYEIADLAKTFKIKLSTIQDFMLFSKMINYVNEEDFAVIGKDVLLPLVTNTSFTDADEAAIVDTAHDLISLMSTRNKSTVPYVEGELLNYKYSLYDSLDAEALLTGIRTDACFRCCGNDNDFLHYCLLNKNGFILKITNSSGDFIARAGGFRNGNCVYINQLRTIYDHNGNFYEGDYKDEQMDIIKVFKAACEKIVHESQMNKEEENPIDFVFVNKSYALGQFSSDKNLKIHTISQTLTEFIGNYPMDMVSDNWSEFLETSSNLDESDSDRGFYTDYGSYPIICIASSKRLKSKKDFIYDDVPAFYRRKRGPITVTKNPSFDLMIKINKTHAIYTTLENENFDSIDIKFGDIVVAGDNWFIICDKQGKVIDSCVLEDDEFACDEYDTIMEEITCLAENSNNQEVPFDFDQFNQLEEKEKMEETTNDGDTSSKRKRLNLLQIFQK